MPSGPDLTGIAAAFGKLRPDLVEGNSAEASPLQAEPRRAFDPIRLDHERGRGVEGRMMLHRNARKDSRLLRKNGPVL